MNHVCMHTCGLKLSWLLPEVLVSNYQQLVLLFHSVKNLFFYCTAANYILNVLMGTCRDNVLLAIVLIEHKQHL